MKIERLIDLNKNGPFYSGFTMTDDDGLASIEVAVNRDTSDGYLDVTLILECSNATVAVCPTGEEWTLAVTDDDGNQVEVNIPNSLANMLFKNACRLHKHPVAR